MNTILTKQNEDKQLQRLSAQRELYSSAKNHYYIQLISNIITPITLSILSLFYEKISPYASVAGAMLVLLDIFLLERLIKIKKEKAAKIQELFDCDVLQLQKSPLKIADDITVEEVLDHYHAHGKIPSNIEKIKNWYPSNINVLPLHIAQLICQRSNFNWDTNLRKKYLKLIISIGICAVFTVITLGIVRHISALSFFLLINAMLPLFQFSIKQVYENRDSISRLRELLLFADSCWNEAINGKDEKEVSDGSRRLQDEIYNLRSQNPLIPDFVYKLFRTADENVLNRNATVLIAEYNSQMTNR